MARVEQIDLNQRRSLGGILVATASLYRSFPLLFALLALAVMAPYELAVLAITGYGPLRHAHEPAGIHWLLLLARASLITPLVSALHMQAVVAIGEGKRPRLGSVALSGVRVLPVVAAAEIMATIGITLGFIAFIIPGVFLTLRWAVVAQAASLEHEGWLAALRSSQHLTATHYRLVFALVLLVDLVAAAVHFGARLLPLGSTSGAVSVAVGIGIDTLIASLSALTLAVLYFDLRAYSDAARSTERMPRARV
ncbi:MAG TPA: hypothetical protein VEJ23_08950 [Solirubrobacteraceae bacterium]|nr:hypothetical protein [Solirubrobacteraceae bacterium]